MGISGLRWRDPSYIPKVVDVRHVRDHVLWLRFDDGLEGEADLFDSLGGQIFEPIRDPVAFARVELRYGTLWWDGDVEWAPESLYERVVATKGLDPRAMDAVWQRQRAYIAGMPEISRFYGIVIRMLADDHNPPHFHAMYAEFKASFTIRDAIVEGHFPVRALRLVSKWHRLHKAELLENWERQRAGKPPLPIAPLP